MMVGSGGPAFGMLQHFPNISSILTLSTGPAMSPLALIGLLKQLYNNFLKIDCVWVRVCV